MTNNDRASAPPSKVDASKANGGRTAKRRRSDAGPGSNEPQIGEALRSVYDRTVSEAIPSEMLDLLGRLD